MACATEHGRKRKISILSPPTSSIRKRANFIPIIGIPTPILWRIATVFNAVALAIEGATGVMVQPPS